MFCRRSIYRRHSSFRQIQPGDVGYEGMRLVHMRGDTRKVPISPKNESRVSVGGLAPLFTIALLASFGLFLIVNELFIVGPSIPQYLLNHKGSTEMSTRYSC